MRQRDWRGRVVAMLIAVMTAIVGCSSEGGDSAPEDTPPTLPLADLAMFPIAVDPTDTDGAALVRAAYDEVLTFARGLAFVNLVVPRQDGAGWIWQVADGALKITLIAQPAAGGWDWQGILDGTDVVSGHTFSNWTVMRGRAPESGTSGSFDIYFVNTAEIAVVTTFERDSEATYTIEQQALRLEKPSFQGRYRWLMRRDSAGSVDFHQGTPLTYRARWIADGSGEIAYYDAAGQATGASCWGAAGGDIACP